jgi:hypothetical protein
MKEELKYLEELIESYSQKEKYIDAMILEMRSILTNILGQIKYASTYPTKTKVDIMYDQLDVLSRAELIARVKHLEDMTVIFEDTLEHLNAEDTLNTLQNFYASREDFKKLKEKCDLNETRLLHLTIVIHKLLGDKNTETEL